MAPKDAASAIKIAPVTGALGAVVIGVDLATDGTAVETLKTALDQHLVLYVPDQNLDRFQLAALGRAFGPPFLHPLVNNGFDDCPEVLELRREPEDTIMFGGASWHADVSWLPKVGYASILHGKEVPPVGGDTAFASTISAFETLSPGLQDTLRGLSAIHAYHWSEGIEDPDWRVTHPVVRRHPATGCEGLYVNRMFTTRFDGMTVAESAPLLAYLFDHMEKIEHTCRFRWRAGGVLIWDNRFTLHYPVNDFSGQRRVMIRTTSLES
ncbi:MAG: TauD/TfdA family dioxygenase [Pseudomonadota bacterium]